MLSQATACGTKVNYFLGRVGTGNDRRSWLSTALAVDCQTGEGAVFPTDTYRIGRAQRAASPCERVTETGLGAAALSGSRHQAAAEPQTALK